MMTETTKTSADGATEGTWAIPLLLLVPVAIIGIFTDLSTPWCVASWVMWGLAAALTVVGWIQVFRYGVKRASGWSTCIPLHCVLIWQAAHLILKW